MKIEIKHRWTSMVLYSIKVDDGDQNPIKTAVERASLDNASLDNASLVGASLDNASLVGASLVDASLDNARLDNARLDNASLDNARLDNARLDNARLDNARLVGARLDNARLDNARLVGARLDNARLHVIRADVRSILDSAPREVEGLLDAIREGRINGSAYRGECACLVGTIANVRGCDYTDLVTIQPDSERPAEKWFTGIGRGQTPKNNQVAAITERWIVEWKLEHAARVQISATEINALSSAVSENDNPYLVSLLRKLSTSDETLARLNAEP